MRWLLMLLLVCVAFSGAALADSKIAPELEKRLAAMTASDEKIPIVVLYEGMPSFAEVANEYRFLGSPEVIREQVIRVMKENAESIHYWLKQLCESPNMTAHVEGFTSIWVVNAVALKATPYAIREIAVQPNVEKILLDEPVPMLLEDKEYAWGITKIKAHEVWKYHDGKGITVAVIDTGVNEHDDLKGRVVDGKNYIDATKPPRDDHSHGTHCAGTVAGDGKAGIYTGVAPKATILAVKVLSSGGSGSWSNLWLGIEEVVNASSKPKVISMSLGGFPDDTTRDRLRTACQNAIAAGVIPVIAAGNSGSSAKTIASPGDVPEVVTVGATDSSDVIAYFSSRGPTKPWAGTEYVKPDVSAPGVNVKSCSHTDNTYREMSGTSMATPHVAGLTALICHAKPEITPAQAKEVLEKTATDLGTAGKDNIYGSGRVNADTAVNAAKTLTQVSRSDRWEMVVKELSFSTTVDAGGNLAITQTIENELMPATVTIWVDIKETTGRKGFYNVAFTLSGPNGTKTGTVKIDFDNIPTDPNKYDAKYGFNAGNFDLVKGTYSGSVKSIEPNPKVQNVAITITGKATWPARTR